MPQSEACQKTQNNPSLLGGTATEYVGGYTDHCRRRSHSQDTGERELSLLLLFTL